MRIKILLLLSIFFNIYGYSQTRDISGIYENDGYEIHIEGDKFSYIFHQKDNPVFTTDTLAYCYFKWGNKDFIILRPFPILNAWEHMIIKQSNVPMDNDSIEVIFSIPTEKKLLLDIFDQYSETYHLLYSKENNKIKIPSSVFLIYLGLAPISPDNQFFVENAVGFCGITQIWSPPYIEIQSKKNNILIEFPKFDYSIFERIPVFGEYAKVSNNSITWKGKEFKKRR